MSGFPETVGIFQRKETFVAEVRDCTPDCPAGTCVFVMQNDDNTLKELKKLA
jgi:hypothetical protein